MVLIAHLALVVIGWLLIGKVVQLMAWELAPEDDPPPDTGMVVVAIVLWPLVAFYAIPLWLLAVWNELQDRSMR
jgi:hypothetical protein